MKVTSAAFAASAFLASTVTAHINILMTNDDGWGSANIRAAKSALEASGHKVLLIGPLENQSGVGGTVVLPTSNVSETGGIYGLAKPGASYYGYNETDTSIRYFNGTPAACALWGLQEKTSLDFFENGKIDLVVTGPNEGTNLGAFVYSLSGTCGAAYASAMFGVPAIAFSAVNSTHRPYYDITDSPYDPATLAGELVANLVNSLADGWDRKSTILPKSIGLNVNFPNLNKTCSEPPYVLTRLNGGAYIDGFKLTEDGFPTWTNVVAEGLDDCLSGDCSLPGERKTVESCQSSISVFSVDYDAPKAIAAPVQEHIRTYLAPVANRRMKKRSQMLSGAMGQRV